MASLFDRIERELFFCRKPVFDIASVSEKHESCRGYTKEIDKERQIDEAKTHLA